MTKRWPDRFFWVAVAIPLLSLLIMTVKPIITLVWGQEITLKTKPVDPTDPFYGDYLRLHFEIKEVSSNQLSSSMQEALQNEKHSGSLNVFVSLIQGEEGYVIQQVSLEKPDHPLYIEGKLYTKPKLTTKDTYYSISYPFESFYIEEGTGLIWENSAQGDIRVLLKVRNGYAILTDIEKIP